MINRGFRRGSRRRLCLLAAIGIHVAVAMVHIFIYRDRIMQRMLPG
jgi:cytochrome b561